MGEDSHANNLDQREIRDAPRNQCFDDHDIATLGRELADLAGEEVGAKIPPAAGERFVRHLADNSPLMDAYFASLDDSRRRQGEDSMFGLGLPEFAFEKAAQDAVAATGLVASFIEALHQREDGPADAAPDAPPPSLRDFQGGPTRRVPPQQLNATTFTPPIGVRAMSEPSGRSGNLVGAHPPIDPNVPPKSLGEPPSRPGRSAVRWHDDVLPQLPMRARLSGPAGIPPAPGAEDLAKLARSKGLDPQYHLPLVRALVAEQLRQGLAADLKMLYTDDAIPTDRRPNWAPGRLRVDAAQWSQFQARRPTEMLRDAMFGTLGLRVYEALAQRLATLDGFIGDPNRVSLPAGWLDSFVGIALQRFDAPAFKQELSLRADWLRDTQHGSRDDGLAAIHEAALNAYFAARPHDHIARVWLAIAGPDGERVLPQVFDVRQDAPSWQEQVDGEIAR